MTESMVYKFENGESPKKMVMVRELTDEEIANICKEHLAPKHCDIYTFARAILKESTVIKHYESDFVKAAKIRLQAGEE
tara:strand:+ start:971 stop:1207 length:237 start_codon:yes stop_codon:yes gene_type:complete